MLNANRGSLINFFHVQFQSRVNVEAGWGTEIKLRQPIFEP